MKFTVHTSRDSAAYLAIDNGVSIYSDDKIDWKRYALRCSGARAEKAAETETRRRIPHVIYSQNWLRRRLIRAERVVTRKITRSWVALESPRSVERKRERETSDSSLTVPRKKISRRLRQEIPGELERSENSMASGNGCEASFFSNTSFTGVLQRQSHSP